MSRHQMIVLASHPQGAPSPENFCLIDSNLADPVEGQFLVRLKRDASRRIISAAR